VIRINWMRALLVFALGLALHASEQPAKPPVAVFHAEGFPSADSPGVTPQALTEALKGISFKVASTSEALAEQLQSGAEVLVLPYGSAFPLAAWEAIRAHLQRGGGLVVLGGAPFHQPVLWQAESNNEAGKARGRWVLGNAQPTFARELLLGPAVEISTAGLGEPVTVSGWTLAGLRPSRTFALTVRFATQKDQPREDGSAGYRDAVLRPLVHMLDASGLPRACPLLEIDRLRGFGAGGRWVLATSDAPLDSATLRACVLRALEGPSAVDVRPIHACLKQGEWPQFRVSLHRPGTRDGSSPERVQAVLRNEDGLTVGTSEGEFSGPQEIRNADLNFSFSKPLPPGLYRLQVKVPGGTWGAESGVWVKDERLLREGPKLTASRDWLRLNGKVFPILGTTYMASDVHRKFLFEPNPALWDRDFQQMKAHGVNLVRTGLWTAWDRLMLDPGAADEGALRALDAFVLTAAKHRMPLCFTFFAFLPQTFGGENPYLDPRALEGQKRLLALVARRYKGCPWIHYDLINEPSYAPADSLWTNRPNGDRFELSAWRTWVETNHGSDPSVMRDLWRDGSENVFGLPRPEELGYAAFKEGKRPRKGRDFRIFNQEIFRRWAAEMRKVLRETAGEVLVTVGQDEAGLQTSPAQQFMAPALDYTALHTWWATDDLVWDGAAAKVPEKPLLLQETGMMRLENLDGIPWRSEENAARLLERKFAAAFASRGAGAVEWAWNVNPYQPLENEAVIGFLRPDGTAKAETRVLRELGDFFAKASPHLSDFAPDSVVLIYPTSRIFAGRPFGADASKRMVRVLCDRYGIVPTILSDLTVTAALLKDAKLILVPVPEMMEASTAQALLAAKAAGALIVVTGAVEGDPYGRRPEALRQLAITDAGRPLMLREETRWGGWATFDGNLGEKLRRSLGNQHDPRQRIWHEPLPLEFAREEEPLAQLLGAALKVAEVPVAGWGGPASSRVLESPKASLVVCLNESPVDVRRIVKVGQRNFEVPIAAGRSRLVLVDRSLGHVLAETPGEPVQEK